MKAPNQSTSWGVLTILCLIGLFSVFTYTDNVLLKFHSIVIFSMVANFWCYQKKQNTWFFFLPLIASTIMMVLVIISIIGWAIGQPIVGFWSKIFGLNAFITALLTVLYAIMLLDSDVRSSLTKGSDLHRNQAA